ncbi:zinc-binding dehydrogenase [uncultured Oscillibacter sp.]|uniref:zinc-binding dehydrogenase n=1 Tax=uncultured Oscillibacter sp. TaxID=876091 RepID=UPI0025F0C0F3|nr:zinc-binding dehydrogenase [uncultured Oscillibacter sp.]
MKSKGVRLYGAYDIRLEEFDLPEIQDGEILVRVMSDSICMSTYKLLVQGKAHKRCPQDVDEHPVIIGHEFAGDIVKVGKRWRGQFRPGEKFAQQPALNYKGSLASPGYSYPYFGGACTYCVVPPEVMELGYLLHYDGESYFEASLGEPMSCVVGGYHGSYHTSRHSHEHIMGVKEGGRVLIMGGCGPMGLGAIEYPMTLEKKPAMIVVTDLSDERIARARQLIPESLAAAHGIRLVYVNPGQCRDEFAELMALTGGEGYDDIFVYNSIRSLAEMGDRLLGYDGCMNFFSGPTDKNFSASINLYNCHYSSTHIIGTTGGTTGDLKEAIRLAAEGKIRPAVMITHVGGMDSIVETTKNLPGIPGGKKLTYTQFDMPLTAIADFREKGKTDPLFRRLADCCDAHDGLWNSEAERILFQHFHVI